MKIFKLLVSMLIMISCIFLCTEVIAFPSSSSVIYDGIDVSEWQGYIDFSQVSNSGIKIVYIRASEGNEYKDPDAKRNYQGAKRNGLKVGFYHFLTATNEEEAIEQADFFASVIKGLEVDCRLAMDYESFNDLSIEEINHIAEAFLNRLQYVTGKDVIIYSDAYNAANVFSNDLANKYPIWVADYDASEPMNGNWSIWDGFQYSDTGEVEGISGYVDRDYFTSGVFLTDTSKIPDNTETKENSTTIIIQPGDTLSQIAEEYNTSYQYLAKINNIINPNLIYAGQSLIVPVISDNKIHDTKHTLYIVQTGDTLWQISLNYGVSINDIVRLNNIVNPNLIYVGQILRIPSI